MIIFSAGLSYIYWNGNIWNPILKIFGVAIFFYVITHRICSEMNFKGLVWLLALYPFISIMTSAIEYEQSFLVSFRTLLIHLIWLSYFIFHKKKYSEETIIKGLLWYSLIVVFIQVFQQFSYPIALFGVESPETMYLKGLAENVSKRNGLFRFRIGENAYVALPVLLYYVQKCKDQFSVKKLIIILLLLVSVYLTLTRQVMACALFVLALALVLNNTRKKRKLYLLILLIIGIIGISFYEILFAELGESTEEELNDDNIRFFSYLFYYEKIVKDGITFFLGNGIPGISGPYRKLIDIWQLDYHYWPVDIGFVGFWFFYGFIYIALYLYFNYLLLIRYKKQAPTYLKLTVVYTLPMSFMIFPFWGHFCYFYWAIILYLYDLNISKYKLEHEIKSKVLCYNTSIQDKILA